MNLPDEFYSRMVASVAQFRRELVAAGYEEELLAMPLVDQLDDGSIMVKLLDASPKRKRGKKSMELPAFEDVATHDDLPFVEIDGD